MSTVYAYHTEDCTGLVCAACAQRQPRLIQDNRALPVTDWAAWYFAGNGYDDWAAWRRENGEPATPVACDRCDAVLWTPDLRQPTFRGLGAQFCAAYERSDQAGMKRALAALTAVTGRPPTDADPPDYYLQAIGPVHRNLGPRVGLVQLRTARVKAVQVLERYRLALEARIYRFNPYGDDEYVESIDRAAALPFEVQP